MTKTRKKRTKKYRGESAAVPAVNTVHRFNAETEDRRARHKKLKLKGAAAAVVIGILLGIGLVVF